MKKIIIKCFKTLKNYYFYDRYTNSVVKVDPVEYSILEEIEKEGIIPYNEIRLKRLTDNGLLNHRRTIEIKHTATDDIEYYSTNKVQQLILQVTQQCNLRCEYCAYSGYYHNRGHSDRRMTFDIACKAIDFYLNHSNEKDEVTIAFYGGEPLLEFSLIRKCVEYVEEKVKDKEISFYITTNGTLLTDEIIIYLCKHKINLTISLDGNEEEHDINRKLRNGQGSFGLIMDNLKRIKYYDEDYFSKVRYNTVINPKSELKKVLSFFAESEIIDPKQVRLNAMANTGVLDKSILEVDEYYWIPYKYERMKLLLYLTGKIKYEYLHPLYAESGEEIRRLHKLLQQHSDEGIEMHHGGPCLAGVKRLFVNVYGEFFPCERVSESMPDMNIGCLDKGYDLERIHNLINIGELTRKYCLDCWNLRLCKICAGQIEPIDNKLTCEGKLLQCSNSKRQVLGELTELCVLIENGYNSYREELRLG